MSKADGVESVEEGGLKRELGFFSLVALIVGSMVGSGIFFLPGAMLGGLGTADGVVNGGGATGVMLAWVVGAVVALCGGLMFAELGGAFPRTGGQYAFLRKGTGRMSAFMFSWTAFAVVQSGTIAAVAVAFANAVDRILRNAACAGDQACAQTAAGLPGHPVPLGFVTIPPYGVALLALAVMSLLTWVNYLGVKGGALVSNLSTVAKVAALVLVAAASFLFAPDAGSFGARGSDFTGFSLALFGAAAAASLFAYDGFAQATFVAGEVKDARRVLPRAILAATLLVAAIYLTAVFAFFHAVHPESATPAVLAGNDSIAMDAAGLALGSWAVVVLAVFIAISTFGTVNAYILAGPRIYLAVAKAKEFPRAFGHVSRNGTPTYGLVYSLLWAGFLTLTGSFDALANLVVFGLYVFYLVTVIAYFVLRDRNRDEFRSFRIRVAPVAAVVFGVASLGVLASYAASDVPRLWAGDVAGFVGSTTGMGAILILAGAVLYLLQGRPLATTGAPGSGQA
jgi:basic amino acid/polyamine antiporter, APA family